MKCLVCECEHPFDVICAIESLKNKTANSFVMPTEPPTSEEILSYAFAIPFSEYAILTPILMPVLIGLWFNEVMMGGRE